MGLQVIPEFGTDLPYIGTYLDVVLTVIFVLVVRRTLWSGVPGQVPKPWWQIW